jgi:membrane fusion protein, copper/silver efflux system
MYTNVKRKIMKTLLIFLTVVLSLSLASCSRSAAGRAAQGDSTAVTQTKEYYTCPMHPQVHSDKPGSCPICHMDLVKVSNSGGERTSDTAAVTMSDRSRQLANVATSTVRSEPIEYSLRAFGALEIPEPNKIMISARFNGRIEKLYVTAVGSAVRKGQPLFDVYSPDIVQAEHEYLQAYKNGGTDARPNAQADQQVPMTLMSAARSKLQLFGFTEEQIRVLESSGVVTLAFTYHSPASGIVVEKKIVEGIYISEGIPLFEISDMSALWNVAEVYETDAGRLRVGDRASVQLQNVPTSAFSTAISFISPVMNPQSRTVKVRMTVTNTSGALKPNTYTETIFRQARGLGLTVPVSAVLVTGKRTIVYVETSGTRFESREVGIGVRFDGKYEITHGLRAGDVVVSNGGYLIDSESQLKSGGGM